MKKANRTKEPKPLHLAQVVEAQTFILRQLPTITAYLDAGMSAHKLRAMLSNMYKKKVKAPNQALFVCLLMQQVKEGEATEVLRFSRNWNNKLCCEFYTTIRLFNPKNHKKGVIFQVMKT